MTADRSYAEPLLDLQRLVAGIRWRRRLWLPMAALGLLIGIALAVVAPPQPVASVKVLVLHEEDQPNDGGALIATDIALLQTNRIAEQVLKKVGSTDKPEDFVEQYSGIPLSNNVMEITVEADTAEQALARAEALSSTFIADHRRRVEASSQAALQELQDRQRRTQAQLNTVNKQIAALSDATDPASTTRQSSLFSRKGTLEAKVQELIAQAEDAGAGTGRIIAGTTVVDAPRIVPESLLVAGAIKALVGLGLGLVLGLGLAGVLTVVHDRPVLRREITAHLGASVITQLPPRRLFGRTPGRNRKQERRRAAATLARTVRGRPGSVSVLELGAADVAAELAADMAVELAREGKPVVLINDLPDRDNTEVVDSLGDGVWVVDGTEWPEAGWPHPAIEGEAGYTIGVGTLRPGAPWTDLPRLGNETLLVVRAGHAATEWLHTVARQLADAGIVVIGVVLVDPDPRDRTDGTLWDALHTALRGRAAHSAADTPSGTRAPDPGALPAPPARPAAPAHQEVS